MSLPFVHYDTRPGEPVLVGKAVVVPVAKTLHIEIPGLTGGLVWNRPVAVKVKTADGGEQILPVQDVTRQALLGIAAFALIGALLVRLIIRK